jgi:hypothetical protein
LGRLALATEINGSVEGPARAGVNAVAVSAAEISSAERKETKTYARICGKPPENGRLITREYFRFAPPAVSRLAWHPVDINQQDAPRSCC